eukprot:Platyproteum_vivax@DN5504_c0_g1_i1.p1
MMTQQVMPFPGQARPSPPFMVMPHPHPYGPCVPHPQQLPPPPCFMPMVQAPLAPPTFSYVPPNCVPIGPPPPIGHPVGLPPAICPPPPGVPLMHSFVPPMLVPCNSFVAPPPAVKQQEVVFSQSYFRAMRAEQMKAQQQTVLMTKYNQLGQPLLPRIVEVSKTSCKGSGELKNVASRSTNATVPAQTPVCVSPPLSVDSAPVARAPVPRAPVLLHKVRAVKCHSEGSIKVRVRTYDPNAASKSVSIHGASI